MSAHLDDGTPALHLTPIALSLRPLGAEPHTKRNGHDAVYNGWNSHSPGTHEAAFGNDRESMLFGLKPTDAATIGGAVVLLVITAQVAAYSRVDPLAALRHE